MIIRENLIIHKISDPETSKNLAAILKNFLP